MFIPVLPAAAVDRTQLCTKNLELFNPETHAKSCTKETRSVEHLYNMNYEFWFWILNFGYGLCIMNFDFQFRILDLDIEFLFCMFIQFLFIKVLISNNTQNLLNFNENPNPIRQTEILSSTTNTWTSIKKTFFLPITIRFF